MEPYSGDQVASWLCSAVALNVTLGPLISILISGVLKRPLPEALMLGLFLGPLGWLLIGFLDRKYEKHCDHCGGGLPDPPRKRCPHCGELLAAPAPPGPPPPPPRVPLNERPGVTDDELMDLLGPSPHA